MELHLKKYFICGHMKLRFSPRFEHLHLSGVSSYSIYAMFVYKICHYRIGGFLIEPCTTGEKCCINFSDVVFDVVLMSAVEVWSEHARQDGEISFTQSLVNPAGTWFFWGKFYF